MRSRLIAKLGLQFTILLVQKTLRRQPCLEIGHVLIRSSLPTLSARNDHHQRIWLHGPWPLTMNIFVCMDNDHDLQICLYAWTMTTIYRHVCMHGWTMTTIYRHVCMHGQYACQCIQTCLYACQYIDFTSIQIESKIESTLQWGVTKFIFERFFCDGLIRLFFVVFRLSTLTGMLQNQLLGIAWHVQPIILYWSYSADESVPSSITYRLFRFKYTKCCSF